MVYRCKRAHIDCECNDPEKDISADLEESIPRFLKMLQTLADSWLDDCDRQTATDRQAALQAARQTDTQHHSVLAPPPPPSGSSAGAVQLDGLGSRVKVGV